MNILPKKSWHVLSRDNLEKVRKDEAEAKRIEDDKARRAALAEQEAKINFMRKRARDDQVKGQYEDIIRDTSQVSETSSDHTTGHFNFFADMKSGIGLKGSMNAEHEVEKKQDQEKWEKKVGILTYLVDKDDGSSAPWYLKKEKKEKSQEDRKLLMDPLNEMKGYIETKRKKMELEHSSDVSTSRHSASAASTVVMADSLAKDKKKKKKDKKKKKEEDKMAKLEKMRAERRQREEAERIRSTAVMKNYYKTATNNEQTEVNEQEELGRYNNQFNPHLSRTKR